jgi:ubiquinone biosynthesis protein
MRLSTIPQLYRHVGRWSEIIAVLSKYGMADWLSQFELEFTRNLFKARDGEVLAQLSREARIRMVLTELGPTFIKLGQILSTRPDLVGTSLANELQLLLVNVPPDPPSTVRATIEGELGQPIEELFAEFDETPVASASIGQVHRARLATGEDVAVKVQHAGIDVKVRTDLDILNGLAQLAEMLPDLANYRPKALAAEFQRMLRRELDFGREERNLLQFARDFADVPGVRIPGVYSDLCTPRVLTMDWLEGVSLCFPDRLRGLNLDMADIAYRGSEIYLQMIFTNGVYHADPHPGNIVVQENGTIGLLDFGMVGRIDGALREQIEEMLLALAGQDTEQLTRIIMQLGQVPPGLDESALRCDLAEFISHYGSQPLAEFDLSGALSEIIEIIRRYRIILPASIGMLLKTMIVLEGTSRMVQPRFSLLDMMGPYRRQALRRRLSPRERLRRLRNIVRDVQRLVEIFPRRMIDILGQVQSGKFDMHLDHRGLEPSVNRLVLGMLTSSLFVGSSLMLSQKVWPLIHIFGGQISVLGALGCIMSFVLGLRLIRAINKSGHLDRRG